MMEQGYDMIVARNVQDIFVLILTQRREEKLQAIYDSGNSILD